MTTVPADAGAQLAGLRVLDLSRVLAGPYVGRLLSDLGADVVKVEAPQGDQSRFFGDVRHGLSGFYTQFNAGKRNICVNLQVPEGAGLVLDLAEGADIVVENFRPGVMERLGLGADVLLERNPAVIVLSISGFGQHGPSAGRQAYASVVHAETGLMSRQAALDETEPRDLALAAADYYAALHGMIAVLAAVRLVAATGRGQHIDMSMYDAMLTSDDYAHSYLDQQPVARVGGEIWSAPGGPIVIPGLLYNTWGRLKRTFGLQDGLPPGTPLAEKTATRRRLAQEWMLSFERRADLCAALEQARLAWADIRSADDALSSELARQRSLVVDIDDRGGGTRRVVNSPYRFSAAPAGLRGPAPHRGEHNEPVLAEWLATSADEVRDLYKCGALEADPASSAPAVSGGGDGGS
jgi:CoA:oxalate CoA-transferase